MQTNRRLQRQAVPAEPSEASLRRQLQEQQPGRGRGIGGGGSVAGVLRSARSEAQAEVAGRHPAFAHVRLPQQKQRQVRAFNFVLKIIGLCI